MSVLPVPDVSHLPVFRLKKIGVKNISFVLSQIPKSSHLFSKKEARYLEEDI